MNDGVVWFVVIVGGLLAGAALQRIVHRARVFDDLVDYDLQRRWRDLNEPGWLDQQTDEP